MSVVRPARRCGPSEGYLTPTANLWLQRRLNALVIRLAGDRWPWILRPAITRWSRFLDRGAASAEIAALVDAAPPTIWGGVGGDSYTGWIYQQGFFAALIAAYGARGQSKPMSLRILDIGCGLGKLVPVSVRLPRPSREYIGIDIRDACVEFCRTHYAAVPRTRFAVSRDFNATYSDPTFAAPPVPGERTEARPRPPADVRHGSDWPVPEGSIDVVVAVSVFTHLDERDAAGYLERIASVLTPDGCAIVTVLLKDEYGFPGAFEFTTSLPPSHQFFTRSPERPTEAIAMTRAGLETICAGRLVVEAIVKSGVAADGPWAVFPQDVVVLRKATRTAA